MRPKTKTVIYPPRVLQGARTAPAALCKKTSQLQQVNAEQAAGVRRSPRAACLHCLLCGLKAAGTIYTSIHIKLNPGPLVTCMRRVTRPRRMGAAIAAPEGASRPQSYIPESAFPLPSDRSTEYYVYHRSEAGEIETSVQRHQRAGACFAQQGE